MLKPATPKLFFSLLLLYQLVAQSAVTMLSVYNQPFSYCTLLRIARTTPLLPRQARKNTSPVKVPSFFKSETM